MRKLFAVAIVIVAVVAGSSWRAPAVASGGCNSPLCAYMDIPSDNASASASALYFEGWSLNLNTGQRASSHVLYRTNIDGSGGAFIDVDIVSVPRPDVIAAFGPNVTLYSGWRMTPRTIQPIGSYRYSVLVSDAPASMQSVGMDATITIH